VRNETGADLVVKQMQVPEITNIFFLQALI
jgi:hypothetical protein